MDYKNFHKDFHLNGKRFDNVDELLSFSKTFSESLFSFLKDWFTDAQFIEVKTSGSTGKPKKILLKKKHMVNSALATGNYFNLHDKTTALLCLSPNYIAGKMMLVRALVLGWWLDVVAPNSNPLKNIDTEYDFCAMIPLQLYNSISQLYRIKKLIVGGGVVSNKLIQSLQGISTKVYATYGMTETITHIAVRQLNGLELKVENSNASKSITLVTTKLSLQGAPIAIGITWQSLNYKTLPSIKISTDNRSCLVINAPKVSDKPVVTNDIVELVSDTEFKWVGRYDTIINSGGIKLIPEQIEEKLSVIIGCRFFVTGIPDAILGEKLVLLIESKNYSSALQFPSSLHKYEIPKETFFIKKFIETDTKKIDRGATLKQFLK